jgi:hypothetical protein
LLQDLSLRTSNFSASPIMKTVWSLIIETTARRRGRRRAEPFDRKDEQACGLLQGEGQAVEIRADDGADRVAGQRQHGAVLVGEHDRLRASPDGGADISGGIDAGHVRRALDIAHGAAEPRLGSAEGETITKAANAQRILAAVEEKRARTGRTTHDKTRLDDAEVDAPAVGIGGGNASGAGQGQHGEEAGTQGEEAAHGVCSRRVVRTRIDSGRSPYRFGGREPNSRSTVN